MGRPSGRSLSRAPDPSDTWVSEVGVSVTGKGHPTPILPLPSPGGPPDPRGDEVGRPLTLGSLVSPVPQCRRVLPPGPLSCTPDS